MRRNWDSEAPTAVYARDLSTSDWASLSTQTSRSPGTLGWFLWEDVPHAQGILPLRLWTHDSSQARGRGQCWIRWKWILAMWLHHTEKLDLCVIVCLCVYWMHMCVPCYCRNEGVSGFVLTEICGLVCLGGDTQRHESSHPHMTVWIWNSHWTTRTPAEKQRNYYCPFNCFLRKPSNVSQKYLFSQP